MSCADIVTALYFYKMRHWPDNPANPERDRLIFSKGHSVLAQYAALAECGYFPVEALPTTKKLGSFLQGHPERDRTPGIEANTGSLGQGLSIGLGMALAARLMKSQGHVIVADADVRPDWEAVTAAAHSRLTPHKPSRPQQECRHGGDQRPVHVGDVPEVAPSDGGCGGGRRYAGIVNGWTRPKG